MPASQWAIERGKADYYWSKQAVCAYIAQEAMTFLKQGIRLNGICPGPTDTPLAQANKDLLEGALRAAWKLRMDKNAKTTKTTAKKKPAR